MSVEMVRLKDLLPNPYRHVERYAIIEEKVEALIQSYENSGFWHGSIQGRRAKGDRVEVAFGHHRVEAARRKKIDPLGVVVAKRTNEDMLRMMADENRSEFKHDSLVAVETIAAVVEAYGRGEIELEAVPPKQDRAGVIYRSVNDRPYTLATVARFLGWTKPSDGQATNACRVAFDAYQSKAAVEAAKSILDSSERSGRAMETITTAARVARTSAERAGLTPTKVLRAEQRAAFDMATEIKKKGGAEARADAASIGKRATAEVAGTKAKGPPPVEIFMKKIEAECDRIAPFEPILVKCRLLLSVLDDLDEAGVKRLADKLESTLKRTTSDVEGIVRALRSGNRKRIVALLEKGA